ncbi:hypothetical protein [Salsuginibacillus kocurii]|uniref:hypothetical protein n=1 Tax=Salsuginibacillus kocurii TaxID=427078 RepID=UPI000376C8C6|nr:hypothetical protein [Salsuginibacillus kocurii]
MKKWWFLLFCITIVAAVAYDITLGTLPTHSEEPVEHEEEELDDPSEPEVHRDSEEEQTPPYKEVLVEPGDTVLTVVESIHDQPVDKSIEDVKEDFMSLNEGTSVHEVISGRTYLFPHYQSSDEGTN